MSRPSRHFYLSLLLLAAATVGGYFGLKVLRRHTTTTDRRYIAEKVPITDETRLLQELLQIDTTNPPGNERPAIDAIAAYLKQRGVASEIIETAPHRAALFARINGKQPSSGLLMLSHIDVVPVNKSDWSQPPFSGKIVNESLWGRGVLDMKGIAVCHIAAFVDVASAKQPLEHDLVLLVVPDEEEGGHLGTEWLMQHRPDIFAGVKYAISEGGITEIVGDRLTYYGIEIGTRQYVDVTAASSDRRELQRLRIALEPYFDPHEPQNITPGVRDYFRTVAPTRKEHGEILADVDGAVAEGKYWLLDSFYRQLTASTVSMRDLREVSPGRFESKISLLNLPEVEPDHSLQWLKAIAAPFKVQLTVTKKMGPSAISDAHAPFVELIRQVVTKKEGPVVVGPVLLPYAATDCRYLRNANIQCYGVVPFKIDFFQSTGIHGANEHVRLDWFTQGVELTRDLVRSYALAH